MRSIVCIAIAAFCTAIIPAHAGTASVDMNSPRQTIDGFGGSSAWSAPLTDTKADVLFGNANNQQLGLSLLRIRIDPNNGWAAETTNSQKAHARGAKVIGTAWTPPASMKTNNNVVGGALLPGQYGAYVTFLNSASDAIGLDYVSPQNEPDITVTYESCTWTPANFLTFCLNNAQDLNRPLVVPESFHFDDAYSDPVLNDPTAASRVAIVGGHIYGAGLNTHQNALNKGKRVWMTEHYFDNASTPSGEITVCMNIAKDITDCMANNMSAYIWWWMYEGLPYSGCDILIGDTPQKNAYVIAQFAKWVRPGCVRVDATYNPSTGVYVTGYKNSSGQAVIIAVNSGGTAVSQAFAITNGSATSVNAYRTSASENLVSVGSIGLSAGTFTTSLPAQSVTTFVQIDTAPTFTTQPASQVVTAGSPVALSAAASGAPVPTYQWKKDGVAIAGATGNTYTIASTVVGDSGTYTVVATNSVSSVTSNDAILTVNPPPSAPTITTQPVSQTVTAGSAATFSVVTSGYPAPTYQWTKNTVALAGATNASYTIASAALGDAGTYTVVATNSTGSVTSDAAVLTVNSVPVITTQPAGANITTGAGITFTAAASGTPTPTYQWRKDNVAISGATAVSYTIASAVPGDAGNYTVVATNAAGSAVSTGAVLGVGTPPAGFDTAGYLVRYPAVAAVFGSNTYGAWLYYRNQGIYDGEVFDEVFRVHEYLSLYPDLLVLFGADLGAALDHWLSTGRIEGKLGRIPQEFSAAGYFTRNSDVAIAVGNDPVLAWGHYWLYGIYEGRAYDEELRVFEYLAINADLTAAFVNDWRQAALHWMRYGRTEGRLGRLPLTFNVTEYLVRSPDVAAVWGTNPTTVFLHYWIYGIDENRTYDDLFRPDQYLALNPDLALALGTDRRLAFKHWVRYGQTEGRPGRNP